MKRPEMSLENKSALITGASGGIGRAIARAFAAAGARLFLHGTSEEKLRSLQDELKAEGFDCRSKAIALRTPRDALELVDAAVADTDRLDVLVNSAGINRPQKSVDVTEANWDDVLNINLKMLFFVSQAAGKIMIEQGGGKIIHISSQAGLVALPLRAAYCSSKGGVNQLTRTLACEWAPHHITVNAVAPTFVSTPFTEKMLQDADFKKYVIDSIPLGRMATTDEIAYATLFLASDLANMITGHILTVDGGWTIK